MSMAITKRKYSTPFGLPRIVIATLYFVVLCATGLAIQAADPIAVMMKLNGAFSEIENEVERDGAMASVVGFGMSMVVLSGVAVGPVMDLIGAKFTALLGLTLHTLGYVFLFLFESTLLYYVAGFCFGFGFQCLLNSHLSVACLFPNHANLALSIISAGPDISLMLPPTIQSFAEHYGGAEGVQRAVTSYLLIFVSVSALIDIFLLPFQPYTPDCTPDAKGDQNDPERIPIYDREAGSTPSENAGVRKTVGSYYWPLSVKQQLQTLDFWIFVPLFVFAFARKKHLSLFIRPTLMEIDPHPEGHTATFYVELYNQIVPYGFIPAILWGGLVQRFGIIPMMVISNTLGVLYCMTSVIPSMSLQLVTIGLFIIYQSFLMGQAIMFIASTYGFETLATLQGLCSTFSGIGLIAMDFFWPSFISHTLNKSYYKANWIMLGMGIVSYIFPVVLWILKKKRQKRLDLENALHVDGNEYGINSLLPPVCYDRGSISVLGERASLK